MSKRWIFLSLLLLTTASAVAREPGRRPAEAPIIPVEASKPATGDDIVLVTDDKQASSDMKKTFNSYYTDVLRAVRSGKGEASVDLFSLQYFRIGVILGGRELSVAEVEHDANKLYATGTEGARSWNEITLGAQLAIPANLTLSNIVGPIGLNVGGEFDWNQKISITVPTRYRLDEPLKNVLRESWRRTVRAVDSVRAIRIPRSAAALTEKYPAGSEIRYEGNVGIVARIGASVGVPVANANFGVFALMNSDFERRLRVLHGDGKKLVRLSVRKAKTTGGGKESSVRLGVTAFRTSLIDGVFNVSLLSSRTMATVTNSIVFDFTYDLSHPEAAAALTRAMAGDLRATQALAVFRDGESRYKGIVINEQRTDVVRAILRERAAGFVVEPPLLKSLLGDSTFQESFGGFLSITSSETEAASNSRIERYFRERESRVSHDWEDSHGARALWGLIEKDLRHSKAVSSVWITDGVDETGKIAPFHLPRLEFDFSRENGKNGDRVIRAFLTESRATLAASEPGLSAYADEALASGQCTSRAKAKLEVKVTMTGEPLRRIGRHREEFVWWVVAKITGAPIPFELADAYFREQSIQQSPRELQKIYRRFDDRFVPAWRKLHELEKGAFPGGEIARDERRSLLIRDLLKAWGNDPLAARMLVILGQPATPGAVVPKAWDRATLQLRLRSKKCAFDWAVEAPRVDADADAGKGPFTIRYEWND